VENAGRYSLVLESSVCRTDPVFALVDVSSIPTMEISATAGELFCEGSINELSVPLFSGSTYQWKLNGSLITGVTGNTYNSTETGTYDVSVTNIYGCSGTSSSLYIKEVKQPVAAYAEITSSCLNEAIQFENNSTYDDVIAPIFHWDFGDGVTSSEKNPLHTYTKAGSFNVILNVGYDNTTCGDTYQSTISVAQFLNLEIKADGQTVPDGIFNLCDGNEAVLSVLAQDGQVKWNTGETTAKIKVNQAGIYSVTSGAGSGCSSFDEIEVKVVENVALEITSGSQRIESGESAQLAAAGAEFYDWIPAEDLDNPMIANPLASPLETTDYKVYGSNSFGCLDSAFVTVYVDEKVAIAVDAPRSFTPNGDGQNDFWIINNIDVYESCPIRIFNRNGQNVYESSQYNNDWDGYMNGQELPEGAYYFILTCGSSEVHTGDITLIR
jgi:gliding motility-associated-like protein